MSADMSQQPPFAFTERAVCPLLISRTGAGGDRRAGSGYPIPWPVQTWLPGTTASEQDPSNSEDHHHDLDHDDHTNYDDHICLVAVRLRMFRCGTRFTVRSAWQRITRAPKWHGQAIQGTRYPACNRCGRRMMSSIWRHSIPGSRVGKPPLTRIGRLLYAVCTQPPEDEHDS